MGGVPMNPGNAKVSHDEVAKARVLRRKIHKVHKDHNQRDGSATYAANRATICTTAQQNWQSVSTKMIWG